MSGSRFIVIPEFGQRSVDEEYLQGIARSGTLAMYRAVVSLKGRRFSLKNVVAKVGISPGSTPDHPMSGWIKFAIMDGPEDLRDLSRQSMAEIAQAIKKAVQPKRRLNETFDIDYLGSS